ncbi:BppU family phage baseplate upper protein [Enterococcus faecium]|uniref:BppU family phage baseplate upper protein n=1 Tax=Enterococcus faecium TaxID=1352 RepID=UPI00339066DE
MNEDNKIFKTNEFSIEISPVGEAIQAKDIQYFSYDENSGLQLIHILMEGKPLDLPNGTEIRLSAVKLNNQNQKLIYTPEIVDPLKGIVSFVIPREFLGYQGRIRCGLYINFSNNQTMHVGYFYINMGVSDIDTNLTEFTEDFWQGWSEFEAGSTAKMQELERRIDEQTEIFNNADVYNKAEIEDKLEPFALRTDIDTLDAVKADKKSLALTDSKVADLDSVKADKKDVDAQLAQKATKEELKNIGNASPKGTYATLSALKTAYPNGTTGIYVVTDDGKWYFWNGSAWTAGGQYQSTGIADKSITPKKIEFMQTGINKFDKTSIKSGQYVSYLDGSLLTNANYGWVEIPVSGGRIYARNNINQHFAWYDANGVFIPNPNAPQVTTAITAPANATILRMSVLLTNLNTQMLVEGSIVPDYEPYRQFIPALYLDQKPLETNLVEQLINVPSKIHALTGMSNNMYYENIMNKALNKDIDVVSTKGFQFDDRYAYTPSVAEVVPLKFSFYEKGKLVNSKSTSLEIKTPSDITSNFKAVFIGDSNTNAGVYTQKILDLFSTDVSKITLVGTRGNAPNLHEGRSGWSASTYTSNASLSGIANAFWNPSTSKFDFAYWASQNSITGLTHTFIALGTNDIFNFATDTELRSGVVTVLNQFDEMVSSVKSHSGTIKIGIMLPIPPSGKQNDFASAYGAGITRWRYKRNYDYFVSELIKRFDNKTSDNIHLVSSNLSIDPDNDFINSNSTPAVHPNTTGYNKMGEQVYKFLKVVG